MAEAALLKHQLNHDAVEQIREIISVVHPGFDGPAFTRRATDGLEQLELKARVEHIVAALARHLPSGFCQTARILEAVGDAWPADRRERNWTNYAAWPLIDYVSIYGLAYPQRAFQLLEKLTPLFTAEFAIRPFLQQHFELTHQQLLAWCQHENEHVRRLASEGIRPRLPWAPQLKTLIDDPNPIWPVLEQLKADPSLYVRRSVANNLNDISKDHAEQVLALCRQWQKNQLDTTDWIIRHGLRTLVRSGYPDVFALLGYTAEPELSHIEFELNASRISLGDTIILKLALQSAHKDVQHLVVDYRIQFVKANGELGSKVFKWKNISLKSGETLKLEKKHAFKPISTRRYYPGKHRIDCLINGQVVARAEVELRKV
jgi:3-methyladenine DNA glycosylase AlkC